MLAPHIEKLAAEHPVIRRRGRRDRPSQLAGALRVQSIPTVIRCDGGDPTAVAAGALLSGPLTDALRVEASDSRPRAA